MHSETNNQSLSSEYIDWLNHPFTASLLKDLQSEIETLKDSWASGSYTSSEAFGTVQLNARALGQHEALIATLEAVKGGSYAN